MDKHWTVKYLLSVLELKNWSMNQLASATGVAASTINRPLRTPSYKYGLSPKTVQKIHEATGIDPAGYAPQEFHEPVVMYEAHSRTAAVDLTALARALHRNDPQIRLENGEIVVAARVDREGLPLLSEKLEALRNVIG